MIDFNKQLGGSNSTAKLIDPEEIYDGGDRASDTGPLRPAQISVLKEWFTKRRALKDLIIKMHTGQGKTLIGLLNPAVETERERRAIPLYLTQQ